MSVLFVLPAFLCLLFIWQKRVDTALLSVYLPCLLLVPDSYEVRLPHLPPLSTAECALIPLGTVALFRLIRSGSFAWMDLLVLGYTTSVGLSEFIHVPNRNNGILGAAEAFISMGMAYLVGRQLVEPRLRFAAVRRMVFLLLLNGPTNLYEWKMGASPWGILGVRVFGAANQFGEGLQFRNGRARVGYVFGGGECAGIAFGMGFCLNAWLTFRRKVESQLDLNKVFRFVQKYYLAEILLLLYVFATQSRGPEIALGAGFLILQIARFKKVKRMMVLVALALGVGFVGTSAYFNSYTSVDNPTSEQQGSAMYRKQMNAAYAPIAEAGGWTGYSAPGIPHVDGMNSIDNQYLLVHLAWGRLAYYFFILVVLENVRTVVMRLWQSKASEDRAFFICMLAAMSVLWITILTVFLGSQLPQLSFFLIGWIQSAVKERPAAVAHSVVVVPAQRYSFRRVFT